MKIPFMLRLLPTVLCGLILATSANAAMVVWSFDLPSTALASQSPPYPVIATLTLEEVGSDVKFTLDPNESNPGFNGPGPGQTEIQFIDFVYQGRSLTDNSVTDFGNVSGAGITLFDYETNQHNLESSYTTEDEHIRITFANGFDVTMTSMWTIFNTTLSDFTDTFAVSNSHPSPTFGVISIAPFNNTLTPNTSNWVTGANVPEPGTLALLGLGILGMGLARHKRA